MEPVFPDIVARMEAFLGTPAAVPSMALADQMLLDGEAILEAWLAARGEAPDGSDVEGFRLLGLHRQGCKGDPSFNACRETCREVVFRRNTAALYEDSPKEMLAELRLQAMVVTHLALFVGGKMAESGLGDFCCASRPLRQAGAA